MLCLVYPLQGKSIPVYRAQIDVDFRVLTKGDVNAYVQFRPKHGREDFERRLARGDRCFASWHEGRIVDAGWAATGAVFVPYLGRFMLLEPGDIYSYGAYTLPDYRVYGLYMARNSYTARRNQKEGFRRTIALVAPENYSACGGTTRFPVAHFQSSGLMRVKESHSRRKNRELPRKRRLAPLAFHRDKIAVYVNLTPHGERMVALEQEQLAG